MRIIAMHALATAALIGVLGWVLGLVFIGPGEPRAIWIAAAIAFVVQLIGFSIARVAGRPHMMAGWGVGMLLRLGTLVLCAFVVVPALGLPSGAALISLVAFFFVSTLVEPLFLSL